MRLLHHPSIRKGLEQRRKLKDDR
ncbi:unnamed protein product [Victoria cruziana]